MGRRTMYGAMHKRGDLITGYKDIEGRGKRFLVLADSVPLGPKGFVPFGPLWLIRDDELYKTEAEEITPGC